MQIIIRGKTMKTRDQHFLEGYYVFVFFPTGLTTQIYSGALLNRGSVIERPSKTWRD